VGGLQTQYAPSGYVGLWTRLDGFRRRALTDALEQRSVIQATLMRTTIHMVSREAYWPLAAAVRRSRQEWWLRVQPGRFEERTARQAAEKLQASLQDGPRSVKELGGDVSGFLGSLSVWLDLVRVPPAGTWERRRADRLALADQWLGPDPGWAEAQGIQFAVRMYLGAFGPASWRDIAGWLGVPLSVVKAAGQDLELERELVRYRDDQDRELVDLAEAPGWSEDQAAVPVRFIPHFDAMLLVHARRTGVLPEEYRPRVFTNRNPFSVGTVLVGGRVVAAWSARDGRVMVEPYEAVAAATAEAIESERAALEAFHQ